ncbi:AMP-binding protein [Paenibacillus piri]|uniref:Phosphatase n=1 Tax=Paenibacillus piri TaxID=2547395 RepID=A0A4R5KGX7_9BACL|nr:AMP-binding protein [Paenibacillus piri]TDF93500.1 phosphatase [Paenibacillus piri]
MMFWEPTNASTPALMEPKFNHMVTYGQLHEKVSSFVERLSCFSSTKQLGIIFARNTVDSVVAYLAALNKKDAVLLLDASLKDELRQNFIRTYKPDWIFDKELIQFNNTGSQEPHPDLAVLLTTSGSTGNPRVVRLSYNNLQSNAVSIAEYLDITNTERPITTLPMAYSYGLSIINSHLHKEATLILTDESVISTRFWELFNACEATSFAGVPYLYQMLHRLRFDRMVLPSLCSFTQAGGRLPEKLAEYFTRAAQNKNCKFTMMYGQTEATARISYVPHAKLTEKLGSIGIAIPGGKLELDKHTSELLYMGPNVMMGYAESRGDLTKGDLLNGTLRTGDVGRQDEDGYFWLEGRIKRFIKLYGLRMNLDDIERFIGTEISMPIACVGKDELITVVLEGLEDMEIKSFIRIKLKEQYNIHHTCVNVVFKEVLPVLENGKIDYGKLKEEVLV